MNSLNILSARVSPPPSRSNSYNNSGPGLLGSHSGTKAVPCQDAVEEKDEGVVEDDTTEPPRGRKPSMDEKTALLASLDENAYTDSDVVALKSKGWFYYPKRIATGFLNTLRIVFGAMLAPGFYVASLFFDPEGKFAPFYQIKRLGKWAWNGKRGLDPLTEDAQKRESIHISLEKTPSGWRSKDKRPTPQATSSSSGVSSESESERHLEASSRRHSASGRRSSKTKASEEIAPARRSIRIKLHSEESMRKHKAGRLSTDVSSPATQSDGSGGVSPPSVEALAAAAKSPTSPSAMTKYPRAPAPPRPLIPRRQPSYTLADPLTDRSNLKTLILDLDETLIHSIAKGGRMSSGHMVEVKLNTLLTPSGLPVQGPQHPILYYVHKRPHCDDFLRRVSKWYNLVIFTASVQEYADPVIDWLEAERKFFSGRLYRQHCTFRHGAFIKDLSSVEPDLSRVMILDNSPLSYMFHQGMSHHLLSFLCCRFC